MRRVPIALLGALWLGGCIQVGDFDPVGSAASISGSWLVDGAPPTVESCRALGAPRIQVSFLDNLRPVTHSGLRFECRASAFDTDAEGGSGKVVAAPDVEGAPWRLRLEAVDETGALVAVGQTLTAFVPATERIELPPANFVSGTIVATFTIDGAPPSRARCEELGIGSVGLLFDTVAGVAEPGLEACELGSVGARVAPRAEPYRVRLRTFGLEDQALRDSPLEELLVGVGETARLSGGAPVELRGL